MKHASWVIGGCLIVAGIVAQPAHSQQTPQQAPPHYSLPAGSVGTMGSSDPKSHDNRFIPANPTPAQVAASWGDPADPNKSSYSPWHAVGK